MVANIIRARFPQSGLEFMNYFDGTYLELFTKPAGTKLSKKDYLAKGIEATQTAARDGKIVAMTLGLGESGVSDGVDETHKRIDDLSAISQDELQYKLALFLVCAEKYSYLFLNDGYCVDSRGKNNVCQSGLWLKLLPEYKKPLGAPKGPATRDGYIYTRNLNMQVCGWTLKTTKVRSFGSESVFAVSPLAQYCSNKPVVSDKALAVGSSHLVATAHLTQIASLCGNSLSR